MLRAWALLFFLSGCAATVQHATPAADSGAKQFVPAPGHANLYIFRPDQFTLSAQAFDVSINGKAFGSTGAGTFLFAELPAPASYAIESQSETPAPVVLNVEPGKNYFFRQDVAFGSSAGRSTLQPVDETTGRAEVSDSELLVTHPISQPATAVGCTKDTDCKGERVCDAGSCVAPASQP